MKIWCLEASAKIVTLPSPRNIFSSVSFRVSCSRTSVCWLFFFLDNDLRIRRVWECVIIWCFLYLLCSADPSVHLERCTHFDRARLDQRFEVMEEPAVSICSKFAKSKLKINLPLMIKRKTITKKTRKTFKTFIYSYFKTANAIIWR